MINNILRAMFFSNNNMSSSSSSINDQHIMSNKVNNYNRSNFSRKNISNELVNDDNNDDEGGITDLDQQHSALTVATSTPATPAAPATTNAPGHRLNNKGILIDPLNKRSGFWIDFKIWSLAPTIANCIHCTDPNLADVNIGNRFIIYILLYSYIY